MEHQGLVLAAIGVLGIGAQWIAWRTGWPAIALMLLAGIIGGPLTGFIQPERDFGHRARADHLAGRGHHPV